MPKWAIAFVAVALPLICLVSCERTTTEMDMSVVSELQSIPAEYGALVDVTAMDEYPNWVQLWFQDDQGVIRMVRVQFIANLIHNDVKVITRN